MQAGLSLCWSHTPHCWKSHVAAQLFFVLYKIVIRYIAFFIFRFLKWRAFYGNRLLTLSMRAINLTDEYLRMSRLVWALAYDRCNKYPNLIYWVLFCGVIFIHLQAKDSETYLNTCTKDVEKYHHKLMAVWLTLLRPSILVVHPSSMKTILQASHVSAPKSDEYRFFQPWIGMYNCSSRFYVPVNSYGQVE